VLVLNEMVVVLDVVSSSTSTANAEYEYEKAELSQRQDERFRLPSVKKPFARPGV
jgi:hypothetical protein